MQAEVWVLFLITFKYKIIVLVHFPHLSFDCVHCSGNMNQSWANPTPSNKLTTIVYGHSSFDTWNRKKKKTTACLMLLLVTMATLQKALRLKCHAVSVWRYISLNQRVKLWICTDHTTRQSFSRASSPVRLDLNKDTFCHQVGAFSRVELQTTIRSENISWWFNWLNKGYTDSLHHLTERHNCFGSFCGTLTILKQEFII